jgi:hypothetical protein
MTNLQPGPDLRSAERNNYFLKHINRRRGLTRTPLRNFSERWVPWKSRNTMLSIE